VKHRRPRPTSESALAVNLAAAALPRLVFHDPLTTGTTVGTRDNGQGVFVPGGWKVTSPSDNIRYTSPLPIEEGAVEFDVTGLQFNDTRAQNHRGQLMGMYDASFGDPRRRYSPDLRLNPFKFVLHRYGRDEEAYFANYLKLIMNTDGVNQFEDYSAIGPVRWEENTTYHMRLEWKDGLIRFDINGQDTDPWPFVYRSVYRPQVHDIRIGTNTRDNAILDAVYSNVKIYDFGTAPSAPIVNHPASGATVDSLTPHIDWTGERHTHYQARVTSSADPSADIRWDSGEVKSSLHYAASETLSNHADSFVHVRLRNERGWGPWSAPTPFATDVADASRVNRYGEYEVVLRTTNPHPSAYTDVRLVATFRGPTRSITVSGFWDGGSLYKIRMLPTEAGTWHWSTSSNHAELDGQGGSFECVESSRGFVRVQPRVPTASVGDRRESSSWGRCGMYYNLRFSDGSFQSVIDDRASQHFNYAHGVVHDALANEAARSSSRQIPDLGSSTSTQQSGYFRWIDEVDHERPRRDRRLFFSLRRQPLSGVPDSRSVPEFMRWWRCASKNSSDLVGDSRGQATQSLARLHEDGRESDPYDHPISSTPPRLGFRPIQLSFVGQALRIAGAAAAADSTLWKPW
jgi:hypothetical protein